MMSDTNAAAALALQALAFLARDPDRLERFLALTGMDLATLREHAGEVPVLTSVLDHLMGDETLLLMFAADAGLDPEAPRLARRRLAGYDEEY